MPGRQRQFCLELATTSEFEGHHNWMDLLRGGHNSRRASTGWILRMIVQANAQPSALCNTKRWSISGQPSSHDTFTFFMHEHLFYFPHSFVKFSFMQTFTLSICKNIISIICKHHIFTRWIIVLSMCGTFTFFVYHTLSYLRDLYRVTICRFSCYSYGKSHFCSLSLLKVHELLGHQPQMIRHINKSTFSSYQQIEPHTLHIHSKTPVSSVSLNSVEGRLRWS